MCYYCIGENILPLKVLKLLNCVNLGTDSCIHQYGQYYHHGVQGLLSHVGSQGNVKFYACVGLLLLQLPNLTVLPIFEIKNNTLQSPGCPPTSFRN